MLSDLFFLFSIFSRNSSEKKMLQHATKSQPSNQTISNKKEDKKKRNEWRITKMVLAIFISFVLCYLPLTIVKVIDSDVRYFSKYFYFIF